MNFKVVLAVVVILVASLLGWQIGMAVIANSGLRSDMQGMAAQLSARAGLKPPSSDEDFRRDILLSARQHGIDLTADQITVRRTGQILEEQEIYLAADYSSPLHLLGLTFTLHFTPEARKQFHRADWRGAGNLGQ